MVNSITLETDAKLWRANNNTTVLFSVFAEVIQFMRQFWFWTKENSPTPRKPCVMNTEGIVLVNSWVWAKNYMLFFSKVYLFSLC